jgi:hypothetical protein
VTAHRAFEVGDFRTARREALRVRAAADGELRARADALLARMAYDPLIVWVTLGCALLLLALALTASR